MDSSIQLYKGRGLKKTKNNEGTKIFVFDLDETIGSFSELYILFKCIEYIKTDLKLTIFENDKELLFALLDLFPEFFRYGISVIFQYLHEKKKITNFGQTTSVYPKVEAKVVSITGSQNHSRTPFKPTVNLKNYSDLFMSLCRVLVGNTLKICGNYDNQRHQSYTTQKLTDKQLTTFLSTHLKHISFLFYINNLCKLLHICDTSNDNNLLN